tara:strand:+ start:728 stop:1186 length:459 start_codon:yes stop_codon:yes gene_type:complete
MAKICTSCNLTKAKGSFHKNGPSPDGLHPWCKACRSSQAKENYRTKNTPEDYMKQIVKAVCSRGRGSVTLEQIEELWARQDGKCAITGVSLDRTLGEGRVATNMSLDRIDSNLPYEEGNLQLLAAQVNMMKSNLEMPALKEWCRLILGETNE